ncbi:hypothetical protein D3C80_2086310 [compost metagenome]
MTGCEQKIGENGVNNTRQLFAYSTFTAFQRIGTGQLTNECIFATRPPSLQVNHGMNGFFCTLASD